MKFAVFFLLLLIIVPCKVYAISSPQISPITPESINIQISEHGPMYVVNEIYKNQSSWAYLTAQISTGEKNWLEVAVSLRPGSDAGATSMLREAVSLALINNPENVFRIAVPAYELPLICSGRTDPLPSYEQTIAELEQQFEKVKTVNDGSLLRLRDECLNELEMSKPHLLKFFGKQ